jgi:hypothetical protein
MVVGGICLMRDVPQGTCTPCVVPLLGRLLGRLALLSSPILLLACRLLALPLWFELVPGVICFLSFWVLTGHGGGVGGEEGVTYNN